MTDTFVVIGGDAAGMSAASKAKRRNPELEVIVFEQGDWVSYAACGLPYFIKGEIDDLEDLVAVTPEEFIEKRDIDVRRHHEVTTLDIDGEVCAGMTNGTPFEESYDSLLIATGAHAVVPPFDGMDLSGVFMIHSMDSAAAIYDYIEPTMNKATPRVSDGSANESGIHQASNQITPQTVGIVGGGYVGIEMAEALHAREMEVHLFEMLPHVLDPFGNATAEVVEEHLRDQAINLHLETPVNAFVGDDRVEAVETETETIPIDMAIVGVGVAPNADLTEGTAIEIGPTGAIATDEYGRTNYDTVYAAGDCAETRHAVTGEPAYVPLALTANRAGRAIGTTVTGTPTPVGEIAGTAIVKAFDLEVSRTGIIDHEEARNAGFHPVSTTITDHSRAHYYPGSKEITVTLTADSKSGRVLGASIVGSDRAGKRIDPVATALHAKMTVVELQNLDLAYAPPFGPVWDPILTAARVLTGKLQST